MTFRSIIFNRERESVREGRKERRETFINNLSMISVWLYNLPNGSNSSHNLSYRQVELGKVIFSKNSTVRNKIRLST